jgi:drug/metabolite transporter (DMT)-like permease
VVVLAVAMGNEERGARRFLIPALVGLAGLLLLLPLELAGSLRGRLMLALVAAAVVVVGVASVRLYGLLRGVPFVGAVAVAGLANGVFLLGCSAARGEFFWRWSDLASAVSLSSLADVVEILLIVWLLREMPPLRFAARYFLIPLVTVVESFALVRPELTARMGFGTALLAAGAGMLLWLKDVDDEAVLSLR